MQLISAHHRQLLRRVESTLDANAKQFTTGLTALDVLPPGQAFARGAVHELLFEPAHPPAMRVALLLAKSAAGESGSIIWCDPQRAVYPPALAQAGVDLRHLFLLHPENHADEVWAISECLRCRGADAVIAAPDRLSRAEARRLQLAAERGGGAGILLRPVGKASIHYAALTRWLVRPEWGERDVQRWNVQLIHGHGGRVGQSVTLEICRETNHVRATEVLADRSASPQTSRVPA